MKKKKTLAILMSLCMMLGALPMTAFADDTGDQPDSIVCTVNDDCAAEYHEADCPKAVNDNKNDNDDHEEPVECTGGEDCAAETHEKSCALYVNSDEDEEEQAEDEKTVEDKEEQVEDEKTVEDKTTLENTEMFLSQQIMPLNTTEDEAVVGGIAWTYDEDSKTLTISPATTPEDGYSSGVMPNYSSTTAVQNTIPWASYKTKAEKIVLADGVTKLGTFTFFNFTNVTEIEIADSVTEFAQGAFQGCSSLEGTIHLNADFEDFSTEVFVGTKISSYIVDEDNPYYMVKDDILYSKDGTILVNCPPGKTAVFSQDWLEGVTSIAPYGFRTCTGITGNLVIPENITSIGRQAFQNCSGLTGDLTIPNTVVDLSTYYTFYGCSGMTGKLTLDTNITEIDAGAFGACGFTLMEWKGKVISIGNSSFQNNTSLTTFTLPESLISVGSRAFSGCANLTINSTLENITSIGDRAFENCTLNDVVISEDATVGTYIFNAANIDSLTYKAEVLPDNTLRNANISGTVTLANSVKKIGNNNLNTVSVGTNSTIGRTVSGTLHNVTEVSATAFKGATFETDITISENAILGTNAFENATLKNVTYNAETVSTRAFQGSSMDSITFGNTAKEIGSYAFYQSTIQNSSGVLDLNKVEIIKDHAFRGATLPKTAIIPETVKADAVDKFSNHIFYSAKGLENVFLNVMGNAAIPTAFVGGTSNSIKNVILPGSLISNSEYTYADNQKTHNIMDSLSNACVYLKDSESANNMVGLTTTNKAIAYLEGGIIPVDTEFTSGELATPVKDGYKFIGWYNMTDTSKTNKVTSFSIGQTYIATWESVDSNDYSVEENEIEITMTYGGTPASQAVSVIYNGDDNGNDNNGSITKVDSSTSAIEASFNGLTVTIKAATGLEAGEYTGTVYIYTGDGATHWVNVTLTVKKADSSVTPSTDENETGEVTVTYGEIADLTVKVSKKETNSISLFSTRETALDEVVFSYGNEEIGSAPVVYDNGNKDSGTATLKYDTTSKKLPAGETIDVNVSYGGSKNLDISTNEISVTINPKEVSVTDIEAADRAYDGTTAVAVTGGTLEGIISGDDVTLDSTNAKGTMADANVGNNKAVTVTGLSLNGNDEDYYTLAQSITTTVNISKTAPTLTLSETSGSCRVNKGPVTFTYEYNGNGTVSVSSSNPDVATASISGNTVTVTLKAVGTATITVSVNGDTNYNDAKATYDLTVQKKKSSGSSSSSSSSGSSSSSYSVKPDSDIENGTVKLDKDSAKEGSTVKITVTPDNGYTVDKVTVRDKNGNKVNVKDNGDGTYTFTMPDSKVTIYAEFVEDSGTAYEDDEKIILTINQRTANVFGELVVNDVAPVIRNDRTMLPARFVAEALGGTVDWNDMMKKVTIIKDELVIEIYIGSATAFVNGVAVTLDSPAFIENDRTYLPIRFIAENLGATVTWNEGTQEVTIVPNK